MSKFLKVRNIVLNINSIHKISIYPNKYYIITNTFSGFGWLGVGFGMANISSHNEYIEVCETKHPIDYKILSDWINKIG